MSNGSRTRLDITAADRMQGLPVQFFAKLVGKANAQAAKGRDVINLGQGNPDTPTPPHIVEAMQQASADPLYHKYPPFRGFPFLKEAVAKRYKEDYSVDLDPETEVAVLFGGKTGLIEISQVLAEPRRSVPGAGSRLSRLLVRRLPSRRADGFMPLLEGNGFLPDTSAIAEED